jgi:hypothetical protein
MDEELHQLPSNDHNDYVSALEVIAEASERVVHDLEAQTVATAEQTTFQEVAPTEWAQSERRFNLGMGTFIGGVALGTAGSAIEIVARTTPTDHKSLIIGGLLVMGAGALAVFKGGKQTIQEIGWALTRTEEQEEFISPSTSLG